MKSLVLKNVDIELLKKQKEELVSAAHDPALEDYQGGFREALQGVIHLLDAISDADDDGKTLDDLEVDAIAEDLYKLIPCHGYKDSRTLLWANHFLKCNKFPK